MIKLDYQDYNNGHSKFCGMKYSSWLSYSYILGFLSNPAHNKYCPESTQGSQWNDSISIHFESNDNYGAWGKEGRIHYYKDIQSLQIYFNDLYQNKSKGNGNIYARINSNECWKSLCVDYNFQIAYRGTNTTADILPPQNSYQVVLPVLMNHLKLQNLSNNNLLFYKLLFDAGYNM